MNRLVSHFLCCLLIVSCGCAGLARPALLPAEKQVIRDQLIVHSDFHLPSQHRILDDLTAKRNEICQQLEIPQSDEPIHVYLFEDQARFQNFMERNHPAFPSRRAFFVKNDTTLMVYAYWGERVAEDLRHEVTHAYLHSVVPNLPLWLDEGIAEHFETPRGEEGVNYPHVRLLAEAYRKSDWQPNLARLEALDSTAELSQMDYAEAWLWVHFLLNTDAHTNSLICQTLSDLRSQGNAAGLTEQVNSYMPDWNVRLIRHLKKLADGT